MERVWCDHRYEFKRVSKLPLGDCSAPLLLECMYCQTAIRTRCKATREEKCAGCGLRHRKMVARVMRSGFPDRPEGFFFVTLTAPGVEGGLVWDQSCGHVDGECSGEKGCKVERLPMAVWNSTAPQRWSWFVTEMRRQLTKALQFCGSWETQARGALHRHVIIWCPGVTFRRFKAAVRLSAHRYGFGRQYDVQPMSGADARDVARRAGYCAAYVTKGSERAESLDTDTGELRQGGYWAWSASRHWGQTMKAIRAEQRAWVVERLGRPDSADAEPGGAAALDLEREIYAAFPGSVLVEGCL